MQLAVPCLLALALLASACGEGAGDKPCIAEPPWIDEEPGSELLAFSVASDMRTAIGGSGGRLFYDALRALGDLDPTGPGAFLVSPGDLDPASSGVVPAIEAVLGEGFPWFPIPGNHDAETLADMEFLRTYDPSALAASAAATHYASGPSGAPTTCYSFDSGGAHFVFLNLYYDGSSDTGPAPSSAAAGTVSPPLYAWLEADLNAAAARSPAYLFVFGHEPLYPLPDDATGRVRHRGDSLDAHPAETEAFAELLRDYGLTAYFCGHSHDYSAALVDGLLQVESGRAAGLDDVGAPSSFLRVRLYAAFAEIEAYRSSDGTNYLLKDRVRIRPRPYRVSEGKKGRPRALLGGGLPPREA